MHLLLAITDILANNREQLEFVHHRDLNMNKKVDSDLNKVSNSQLAKVQRDVPDLLNKEFKLTQTYLSEQHAPATRRAYRSDWQIFETWCKQKEVPPLPAFPETVAMFLSSQANQGTAPSTLRRRLAAIRLAHRMVDLEPPTNSELVKSTFAGIRRVHGTASNSKEPAIAERIRAMVDPIDPSSMAGTRDRALLLLGFSGAFRRSELVAIEVEDLEKQERGLVINVRKSKTDQEGASETVAVIRADHYCPVNAIDHWLKVAAIENGPIFRRVYKGGKLGTTALSSYSVALIVKRWALQAGLNPADFAGHSLRSGFLTSAAMNRASLFKMMEVSRHKDPKTVMCYIRQAEVFDDHAGEGLL
jgi:site-specific recombinase XerD